MVQKDNYLIHIHNFSLPNPLNIYICNQMILFDMFLDVDMDC